MKFRLLQFVVISGFAGLLMGAETPELKDQKQKISYSIGMSLGGAWKRQSIDVDLDLVMKGIKDTMDGKTLFTEEEAREVLNAFQKDLRQKETEARKVAADKNKSEGAAFLDQNKKKEGVVVLPSGLQYKVLAEGKGESPKSNDVVTVHYKGTLIDGTEFDSSFKRGQPATFGVDRVIRGWSEAMQLMKPGAKWQLFIPSELAYMERGSPPKIGPNAALIFEVELISFKAAQAKAAPVVSDIIRVPSADEIKAGAKPEIIKADDVEKFKEAEKAKQKQIDTKVEKK